MSVTEFFREFRTAMVFDIIIYDNNDDKEYFTTTEDMRKDIKREYLDNAEISNWYVNGNQFYIDVVY